ncbi:M23 family metallopeptidase [Actinoplanes sp. ATCC 53533]|uniref:M23 family metallopeptidase n=1 Tax=Actinoplanes sp. ATCC 53533 TaxID=1288362 RepID=UPI0013158F05|nr:M23 family metallopeptidase [Actinoplanes sp. ATCC 53533]
MISTPDRDDSWLFPLAEYQATSSYGAGWGRDHEGLDLAAPRQAVFYAAHAAVVRTAGYDGDYGYNIMLDHGDGTTTVYAHAERLLVSVNQQVRAGDPIGLVGSSGKAAGAHLHLEVRVDGQPTDVAPYFTTRGVPVRR